METGSILIEKEQEENGAGGSYGRLAGRLSSLKQLSQMPVQVIIDDGKAMKKDDA